MTQAITFDFHNTLVHCDPWFEVEVRTLCSQFLDWQTRGSIDPATKQDADERYHVLRQAIIEHGNELTAEQCVLTVLDELRVPVSDDEVSVGVETIMMATLGSASAVPGAVELVRELTAANIPMAIVSSAVYHPFLDAALARFGIDDAFQAVITSASSGFYKSRPEIYWTALDRIGARPEDAIHVGDSYRFDVLGGKRAGLATAWLTADPDAGAKTPAPDAIVATLVGAGPIIRAALVNRA